MKIVASVKPFVTITASPAPIETIPTYLLTKCELCLKDLEVNTPASWLSSMPARESDAVMTTK